MASQKVEICLKKKKPTPITNIPLLSCRKSEQKPKTTMALKTKERLEKFKADVISSIIGYLSEIILLDVATMYSLATEVVFASGLIVWADERQSTAWP